MADKISIEPAFYWWVPHNLRKRNHIISKVSSKYCLKTHRLGIKVPNNMKQAIEFDCKNGNTLCWDSVCQDMNKVCHAFEP